MEGNMALCRFYGAGIICTLVVYGILQAGKQALVPPLYSVPSSCQSLSCRVSTEQWPPNTYSETKLSRPPACHQLKPNSTVLFARQACLIQNLEFGIGF